MKLKSTWIMSALGAALVTVAVLAPWRTHAVKPDSAALQAQVRRTIDDFFEAARRQDWNRAADLFSSDFGIYTDDAAGFDKKAYLQLLTEDNIETLQMQLRDMVIHVSSDGTMAWAQYRGHFTQAVRGKRSVTETAESLIFERRDSTWKIVRAHASIREASGTN